MMHAVCPKCSATNRIDVSRAAQAACGKCKTPLLPKHPVELTSANFEKIIANSGVPVLVDFWASWCGPCKMMAPQFEKAATELAPDMLLAKVDTETEQQIGARFGIQSIPTLVLFEKGREKARQPGALNSADIVRWAWANA